MVISTCPEKNRASVRPITIKKKKVAQFVFVFLRVFYATDLQIFSLIKNKNITNNKIYVLQNVKKNNIKTYIHKITLTNALNKIVSWPTLTKKDR